MQFEKLFNFRDLGGHKTQNGRMVKHNLLYRSGRLSHLTPADMEKLTALKLKKIIDLRSPNECALAPTRLPDTHNIDVISLPIFEDGAFVEKLWADIASGQLMGAALHDVLVQSNRNFVRQHSASFGHFLNIIAAQDSMPLIFHCMAGKDRTGFAAALLLSILGVSREDILADYLATNTALSPHNEEKYEDLKKRVYEATGQKVNWNELQPILGVHENYLLAAFEAIEEDYQNLDDYVAGGLKLDDKTRATLENRLLQPAS